MPYLLENAGVSFRTTRQMLLGVLHIFEYLTFIELLACRRFAGDKVVFALVLLHQARLEHGHMLPLIEGSFGIICPQRRHLLV